METPKIDPVFAERLEEALSKTIERMKLIERITKLEERISQLEDEQPIYNPYFDSLNRIL